MATLGSMLNKRVSIAVCEKGAILEEAVYEGDLTSVDGHMIEIRNWSVGRGVNLTLHATSKWFNTRSQVFMSITEV